MKRLIAAVAIVIFILGVSCSGYFLILKKADNLIKEIDTAIALADEKSKVLDKKTADIEKEWKKSETVLAALLPHSELDNIEIDIESLMDFSKQKKYDDYSSACIDCSKRLKHIKKSERPDLSNIL